MLSPIAGMSKLPSSRPVSPKQRKKLSMDSSTGFLGLDITPAQYSTPSPAQKVVAIFPKVPVDQDKLKLLQMLLQERIEFIHQSAPLQQTVKVKRKKELDLAIVEPLIKPRPLPDPKKSEVAQQYMKEKKMQELKKVQLIQAAEKKEKEKV